MNLNILGVEYSTKGKLDAFTQLHIARKLGPTLPIIDGLVKDQNQDKKGKDLVTVLMLSHISDDDTEYVIKKCLGVVTRQQGSGPYAPVLSPQGGVMFDDLTMSDMLGLTIAVIEENLGDFFRTSLADLKAEEKKLPT